MANNELLTVFTAITGGFNNELRPPILKPDPLGRHVEFVCYTDSIATAVPPWEIRSPAWQHDVARRTARYHKIMCHGIMPYSDYWLWLDGNQQLAINPWELVDKYLQDHDFASYQHPQRDCIYDELQACRRMRKDDNDVMQAQVDRYLNEKYPAHNGLIETTVVLRRATYAVRRLNEAWWAQIAKGSLRDQLSLNYALWKLGMDYAILPGARDKPVFTRFFPHR
jgi:hypothetical protein